MAAFVGYNPDLRDFEDTPDHSEGRDDYKEGDDDIPPTHLPGAVQFE